jgi:preprotein translocase subunit SecD
MKIIQRIIPVILACLTTLGGLASDSTPFFQIRLVLDAPTKGAEQMVYRNEVLYVQKTVLLDETALVSATVVPADTRDRDDRLHIEIVFTDKGKKRLATVTRQSIGKSFAFIVRGKVYFVPRIMVEISSDKIPIHGTFTEMEANDLASVSPHF